MPPLVDFSESIATFSISEARWPMSLPFSVAFFLSRTWVLASILMFLLMRLRLMSGLNQVVPGVSTSFLSFFIFDGETGLFLPRQFRAACEWSRRYVSPVLGGCAGVHQGRDKRASRLISAPSV